MGVVLDIGLCVCVCVRVYAVQVILGYFNGLYTKIAYWI